MTVLSEIRLRAGVVRAEVRGGVLDARGLAYASAPARRGLPAGPVVEAQATPSAFPQTPGLLDALLGPALGELAQREDAFQLRVQAPAWVTSASRLPVLLFVPGGGFTTGSGQARWYDADRLVHETPCVVVTVSHRLGALALPAEPGGPSPAWSDLLQAVAWVREHVATFGGDPDDVTVAGDSAGAWWALALSVAEETRGWFRRTLLVSPPRLAPLSAEDDTARRTALAAALDGPVAEAPLTALPEAQRQVSSGYRGQGFAFAPAAGADLPAWLGDPVQAAARLHTEALLVMTTRHEASAFLRPQPPETFTTAWLDAFLARSFVDPDAARALVGELAGGGEEAAYARAVEAVTLWQFHSVAHDLARGAQVPTRLLRLDVESGLDRALSPHCLVLPFLFGQRTSWADAPMLTGVDADLFEATRTRVQEAVRSLLTGTPGPVPVWDAGRGSLLAVDVDGACETRPRGLDLQVHCGAAKGA